MSAERSERAHAPATTGVLHVLCSWCGVFLYDTPCIPSMDGKVSHGVCPECVSKLRSER